MAERQTDDIGVAAVHRGNGPEARVLNGVGAGFVKGVAGGNVGEDFIIGVIPHGNMGHADICCWGLAAIEQDGNRGVDLVRAPAQALEHFDRFGGIVGFSEDVVSIRNGGIGGDDSTIRAQGAGGSQGFRGGKAGHISTRGFASTRGFVHIHRRNMKHPPAEGDELPAAWGVGGKGEDDFVDQDL